MRTPRRGWVLLVAVAVMAGLLQMVRTAVYLGRGDWVGGAIAALGILCCYWLGMGAWRRTPWGLDAEGAFAPPEPPTLSAGRARLYVATSGACAIAAAVALTYQWITASR